MKSLQLNPQEHEIEFSPYDLTRDTKHGFGIVHLAFSLNKVSGEICLSKKEAKLIGRYFAQLAEKMSKLPDAVKTKGTKAKK